MNLPPVPPQLRELARQQLAAEPLYRGRTMARSLRRRLRDTAESIKRIQQLVLQRTRPAGANPHVDGGWANAGEWQKLLASMDAAVMALRSAWHAVKDSEPIVKEVLATWRDRHQLGPDLFFTQENDEIYLLLLPEIQEARATVDPLVEAALAAWEQAMLTYLHLLQHSQYIDGPRLQSGELSDCIKLIRTDRLPNLGTLPTAA
ncbi:hypothetical protein [Hymenobacter fodinae]|uniref:Uncharacterized protein n=1 Tax=Hymenobacter fodinae TaxID=2510796 RepID=A0A4Z0P8T3_9BACT|nr:hypothetical protein [Hymenobacter fodinae]TGE08773.1 hypothetical protein EU556_13890 [Hymenobacter fodinae]